MNNFIYDVETKVYFGENQLSNLGPELKKYGRKVLLTYGGGSIKRSGLYTKVVNEIKKAGLELFELGGIDPNPRVSSVNAGADLCKKENIDVLLAVGGGSVIDATKFIGAATFYDGDAWDILLNKVDVKKCLPILTVLTLAATGSEMDEGGVITNPETKDKLAASFPSMRPKVSFLDPTNTYTVSAYQTACGASDILSHIFEEYFDLNDDLEMLDNMMEAMMKTVIKYAPVAVKDPTNYNARANLMWASSWALNGFINGASSVGWQCHPIEHEVSAIYDITHGLGLAIITPRWMEYTLDDKTAAKYYRFGVNVFGIDPSLSQTEVAKKSIELVKDWLYNKLGLKSSFGEIGIDGENIPLMAKKACGGKVLPGFKPLTQKDIENILKMCL